MIDDDLRAVMQRDVAFRAAAATVQSARAELWAVELELTATLAACWSAPRGAARRVAARSVRELGRRRDALVAQVWQGEEDQRLLGVEAEAARSAAPARQSVAV